MRPSYDRPPANGQPALDPVHDMTGVCSLRTSDATAIEDNETSTGTLLDGKISYTQFRTGNRTGFEPVLLAASLPVRRGERVLEAGCGAGAGLLCLNARMPDVEITGIELDAATANLARLNIAARPGEQKKLHVITANLLTLPPPPSAERVHHAFANPPWYPTDGSASPHPRRDIARRAGNQTMAAWIKTLRLHLRERGTLTLALPASRLAETLGALDKYRFGSTDVFPLWPKQGQEARILLVRGRLGGRAGSRLLSGLTLHKQDGSLTPHAEQILRDGMPLLF